METNIHLIAIDKEGNINSDREIKPIRIEKRKRLEPRKEKQKQALIKKMFREESQKLQNLLNQ